MWHLRSVVPYSLRFAAMALQLITVAVLPNLLSVSELGSYFLLVALVSSLIPLVDVGFIRYSYKYINRYGMAMSSPIRRRALASLAITLPICTAFLYLYIDRWYVFTLSLLYLAGVMIGRLLQINKYFFVASFRTSAAAVFDVLPTMLLALSALIAFIVSLVAMNGREFPLWVIVSMSPVAFLLAYALSTKYLPKYQYRPAINSPFRLVGALRNLFRSMRRSWPVAADAFLVAQVINLPLLLLGARMQPEYLVLMGLFTRVFVAYTTIVSVFALVNLPRFYGLLPSKSVVAQYIGLSLVLFCVMVGALFALHETTMLPVFENTELEIIPLLTSLTDFSFALPGCFGLYFLYISISNVALAANAALLRIVSTLVVLGVVVITIVWRAASPLPDADVLGVVLQGLNVGLSVGLLLMSTVLLKRRHFEQRARVLPENL